MRTVLIIGASKGIGLETVKLALKARHLVRALSRSATAIRLHDPKLEKLDGDALDRDTIERTLVGVDAVIQTPARTAQLTMKVPLRFATGGLVIGRIWAGSNEMAAMTKQIRSLNRPGSVTLRCCAKQHCLGRETGTNRH